MLITLGIIGIVAAMTLPSIIADTRKKEASARLKKFYSEMSQAITLSEIDNGPVMYWEKEPMIVDEDGSVPPDVNRNNTYAFYNRYLAKYLKTIKVQDSKYLAERMIAYFPNGSYVEFKNGTCLDMIFDVNGDTKPNKEGYDKFRFLLCLPPVNTSYHGNSNIFLGVYIKQGINSREDAILKCKNNPVYCSVILQMDNWEFKDDYPW